MVKSKFEIIMWRILAFAIIFTQLLGYNVVFADETGYDAADIIEQVDVWLEDTAKNPIKSYSYEEGGTDKLIYALSVPNIPGKSNICYDANSQGYTYLIKDDAGNVLGKVPIEIDVVCMPAAQFPADLNGENYSQYVDAASGQFLETDDGSQITILSIDSDEVMAYAYVVRIDGGEPMIYRHDAVEPVKQKKNFLEAVLDGIAAIADYATSFIRNALAEIFNGLLLGIGDGIQSLVNDAMGEEENLTVYKIIFNKIEKLDIDYWGIESVETTTSDGEDDGTETENNEGLIGDSPRSVLKNIVSYWYGVLTTIGIGIYLAMLLYIGVRILLSSTTSSAQKYKEMLTSWGLGIVILFCFPYVMKTVVVVNETFIELLDTSAQTNYEELKEKNTTSSGFLKPEEGRNLYAVSSDDAMMLIREQAEDDVNIALSVVYLIMLGQLIVLIGVYYKRVFMMAFLITIFPIVAVLYVWEKTNKGGGRSLTTWTKEYIVLVFTQTFHAITYVVLVKAAYEAFLIEGNWFIFMLSVVFLFNGEKIIRSIFGMKSSVNTIGDLAAAGATAWAISKSVGGMFKGEKSKTTQDEKDEQEASQEVNDATKNTAVNNALSNNYNNNQSTSASSSANASSNTGGSNVGTPNMQPQTNGGAGNQMQQANNQMNNLEAARALIRQRALEERNKKKGKGIIQKGLNVASRATGITLGMASGLASGSLKDGISNAVIANEITGMAGKGIGGIIGYAQGIYRGQRLKMKVRSGAMDEELRRVGFDFNGNFDNDPNLSSANAKIIRNALAAEIYGTRSGGKVKGELKFIKAVEKGIKKENIH